jgi:transposase
MAKFAAGAKPVVDYPGWKSADLNRLKPCQESNHPLIKMKTPDSRAFTRAPKAPSPTSAKLEVVHPHAAGIDIGATEHYVCVPAHSVAQGEPQVRVFAAFTERLDELVVWLKACGVTTVAMESTGVYWIALHQKIETAGLEVLLVDARRVRHVPGRKTDLQDCQWIQQLHTFGLLRGAFRPQDNICQIRSYMRHRGNLIQAAAEQVQHMQKALQQMNILLHYVVSDLDGDTGLRIVDAILAGERNPEELVKLRDPRIKRSTVDQMKAALRGDWRPEHLFVLKQALAAYRFYQEQIKECDVALEALLKELAAALPAADTAGAPMPVPAEVNGAKKKNRKRRQHGNAPHTDLLPHLNVLCGVDLTQTLGVNVLGALVLVSEIGVDMSRWPNEKAFGAWLGLCPNHKISGGRILSSQTRHVVNRAATMLRMIALAVGKTDTVLGHFYRRIRGRAGAPKAITATARKLACLIYHLLKHKEPYVQPDLAAYQQRFERNRLVHLSRHAQALGFQLVPIQPDAR